MDLATAQSAYNDLVAKQLNLDITRGKPCAEQTALSESLDGILQGNFSLDGVDLRNYGGIDGLPSAKQLGATLMSTDASRVLVGGNSSLALMHLVISIAYQFGLNGPESAWRHQERVAFLCPVPGYDRHFAICELFGIEMINVPMTDQGPCMDTVENLIANDKDIRGIWCVPKYSNPTGVSYSDDTVNRIAALGKQADSTFTVMWDNAYAVHHLSDDQDQLASISSASAAAGTDDNLVEFASTSKITIAGAGVAFLASSPRNLAVVKKQLSYSTIGPDKLNQARHVRFLPDADTLATHMAKHAQLIAPRFLVALDKLTEAFGDNNMGSWTAPKGGYFISFNTQPGLAKRVVQLANDAGVKLTPAGATFPYNNDPQDCNIRIAPTFATLDELAQAIDAFVICVQLATVEQAG